MKSEKGESSRTVLIVDALNLFMRHYIAHPAMNNNGESIGGIVGFLYAIVNFSEMYKPKEIIIVWEGGGSSRRRSIYPDYKSKRRPERLNRQYEEIPDTVQNRNYQITTLVEIFKHMPICQIYVPDCEADDVIGYLSRYTYRNRRKVIISSDKDFYQLLDKNTIIYSPTWKKFVTEKEVIEKFQVSPQNFCLAKSICGDISDNINGVPRAGFKSIASRFPQLKEKECVTISEIINVSHLTIADGSKIKLFKNIVDCEDLIKRNWRLIYLDTSNLAEIQIRKISYIIDTFAPSKNKMEAIRILLKEGIQTFNIDRMFLSLTCIGTQ